MKVAPTPQNEKKRLEALFRYNILDTKAEQDFDELVKLASQICEVPISLISLVSEDRQWFKARVGLGASETHRDLAFCAHAIHDNDIFEVANALEDERFANNPLVTQDPNIKFYAGMPLQTPDGFNLGTLCVIDQKPKTLTEKQKDALRVLAKQVINQLELRLKIAELNKEKEEVKSKNEEIFKSINYAKETKHNVLASRNSVNNYFDDVFWLEIPQHVISSDFCWVFANERYKILILADACKTGLSGIFLSLLLNNLLNNIIGKSKNIETKNILNQVEKHIQNLPEFSDLKELKMSVIIFDKTEKVLGFSGAGQNLIYVRSGMAFLFQNQTNAINKTDKQIFENEIFDIDEDFDEYFYLFSDGLWNMFGEDFLVTKLPKLFEGIQQNSIEEQESAISKKIKLWQVEKNVDTNDDILILGFKPKL